MSVENRRNEEVFYVDWALTSVTRMDPTAPKQNPPSKLHRIVAELQTKLRQMHLNDPSLSQSRVFSFCAPPFILLCVFILGVIVPRHPQLKAQVADLLDGGASALLLLASGVLGGLLFLRGAIWVVAKLATSFCEMDLGELDGARVMNAGRDEVALTRANLIVGGLEAKERPVWKKETSWDHL